MLKALRSSTPRPPPLSQRGHLAAGAASLFGDRTAPDGSLVADNFVNWLGDSKVTHPDGSAREVYHGTVVKGTTYDTPAGQLPAGAFTSFDKHCLGTVSDSSDAKSGFWFSASEDRAWDAAGEAKAVAGGGNSAYVYSVYLAVQNPLVLDNVCDYDPQEVARIARRAKRNGHDGLIFAQGEYGPPDYLVFEARQIKSAIGNSGAFDRESDDLTDAHAWAEAQAENDAPRKRERIYG